MKTAIINMRVSAKTKKGLEEIAAEYGKTVSEFLMICYTNKIWELADDETVTSMTSKRARELTQELL